MPTIKDFKYWFRWSTVDTTREGTSEQYESTVICQQEIETTDKWYPCIYIFDSGDPSADAPRGGVYLVFGTHNPNPNELTWDAGGSRVNTEDYIQTFSGGCAFDDQPQNVEPNENPTILPNYYIKNVKIAFTYLPDSQGLVHGDFIPVPFGDWFKQTYTPPAGFEQSASCNLPIFFNYDNAVIYASSGVGTPDVEPTPIPKGDDTEDDDGDGTDGTAIDPSHKITSNDADGDHSATPYDGAGAINTYFIDNVTDAQNIWRFFYNGIDETLEQPLDYIKYFTGYFGDVQKNIISFKMFPFDISKMKTSAQKKILLGRYTSTLFRNTVDDHNNKVIESNVYQIKGEYNNFIDFKESIYLFLPYYGMVSIPTQVFMYSGVKVEGFLDIGTGMLDYYIFMVVKNSKIPWNKYSVKVGMDIPFSIDSGLSLQDFIANNAINAVSSSAGSLIGGAIGAAAGGPVGAVAGGMVGGVLNSAGQMVQAPTSNIPVTSGISGGTNILCSPRNIQIVRVKAISKYPKSYGDTVGRMNWRTVKIKDLTKGKKASFNNFHCPQGILTDDEYNELCNLMEKGVHV